MKLGISMASLYPMPSEECLELLGKAGVENTEFFCNCQSELSDEFVRELIKIKNYYGINILSLHPYTSGYEPYLLSRKYPRRYNDTLDLYKKYAEVAAKLGANILVLHGDRPMERDKMPEYFEHFAKMSHVIEREGIMLTQENVRKFCASDPEFIRAMIDYLGNRAMFTFDVKQSIRSGVSPWEVYDAMRGHIAHIHLSDNNSEKDCMLPSRGDFPFEKLFRIAISDGFDGGALIEVYENAYATEMQLIDSYKSLVKRYETLL